MNFRTYPRIPFYEQIHDDEPFHTDTGRMHAYADIPEAIEYGENFIVHREGPEATPYLPNVIVSSNPFVRPDDYGVPADAEHWDDRTVRNVKMPWNKVKTTKNFLWEKGFQHYCLTPKTRHRVHSGWSNVDWHMLYDSNFGDPYRLDKRAPSVGEHQLHVNPQAARDLGINDGDYVYVDANPADRPYLNADPSEFFYRVSRCMLRVKYNHAYPYNIVMMKHAPFIATERSVRAREHRLPSQPALRLAAVDYPQLAHADASNRHPVPQIQSVHELPLWRRSRQPRRQHGAQRDSGAGDKSRRRRPRWQGQVEAGDDRLYPGQRDRFHGAIPRRPGDPGEKGLRDQRCPTATQNPTIRTSWWAFRFPVIGSR
jgi:hypothetical protein